MSVVIVSQSTELVSDPEARTAVEVRRLEVTAPTTLMGRLALAEGSVPAQGSQHESLRDLYLVSTRVRSHQREPELFDVELRWGPQAAARPGATGNGGVIAFETYTETIQRDTYTDAEGNFLTQTYRGRPGFLSASGTISFSGYVNAAKLHKLTVDVSVLGYRVTRRERALDEATVRPLLGGVNRSPFLNQPSRQVWFRQVDERQAENGDSEVTYNFVTNPDTWRARLEIEIGGNVPFNAREGNGVEYRDARPLVELNRLGAFPRPRR